MHQGRLTRTRGAEDRDELAFLEIEVDARERMDGLVAHDVGLAQAADGDERGHFQRTDGGRTAAGRMRLTTSPGATPSLI